MKRISIIVIAFITLAAGWAWAQEQEQETDASTLTFIVLRDYNGKPVRNASVVLHPVSKDGKQERGGFELKADADGKASYDGVPYGKLRVQVLAPGFQTFGEDYTINKPTMDFTIKLKRPQGQYSIYESHPDDKKPNDGAQSKPQ